MDAALDRVAAVVRAGVQVVTVERCARAAGTPGAGLDAVADSAIVTRRRGRHAAAARGVTALHTVTGIGVVAQVGVGGRGAPRQQCVLAVARAAGRGRDDLNGTGRDAVASNAVVAQRLVDAGVWLFRVGIAEARVAGIARAYRDGIRSRRPTGAGGCVASLSSVARVAVVALRHAGLTLPGGRVAGLDAVTDLLVVAVDRLSGRARRGDRITDFRTVAGVEVVAERNARETPAGERVAGLDAIAGIGVGTVQRRPRDAPEGGIARLGAVAGVAVLAQRRLAAQALARGG